MNAQNTLSLKKITLVFALPLILLAVIVIQLTPLSTLEFGYFSFFALGPAVIGVLQITRVIRSKAEGGFLLLKYAPTFAATAFFALLFALGAFDYGGFSMSLKYALAFTALTLAAAAHIPLFILEFKRLTAKPASPASEPEVK
jgi:hypothetical protein